MHTACEQLLGVPLEAFRDEYWQRRPLHAAGPLARLAELAADPSAKDLPTLIAAHTGVRQVHVRLGDGTVHHQSASAETALAQFRAGATLDLRDVQRWLAPARSLLEQLGQELATSAGYCHAFLSPAGTGVSKHFDNREVFAIQLLGRKRWRVAANPTWPLPLMPHVAGGSVHPFNAGAPRDLLADPVMPLSAETMVLEPGSVVFLPRGWWHDTLAMEDSLSLSFGFRDVSRVEALVRALGVELARDPAWRASAVDLRTLGPTTRTFANELQRILSQLRRP